MPLMDHLGELRRRLTIIVVSLFVTAMILYFATPTLIEFLMHPVMPYLADAEGGQADLYVFSPLGGFSIRFRVAIFMALAVCSPIVLWEILAFFLPALKPNERKWVLPTLACGVVLFILGLIFCYSFILGVAFQWMIGESEAFGTVLADSQTYLKAILGLEIAFGFAFQLPLIVFYLTVFNLVPYKTFRSNWRTVYVVLLVLCAVVTPDANPMTMVFMFAAIISLYELSLFVSRIVLRKRIEKQKAEGTWIDPDEDDEDDEDEDEDSEDEDDEDK